MDVLVIDIGGTRVKFRQPGGDETRGFRSGPELTPDAFVRKVDPLPLDTYRGGDQDAFDGGLRLWEDYIEPHDAQPDRVWRVVR